MPKLPPIDRHAPVSSEAQTKANTQALAGGQAQLEQDDRAFRSTPAHKALSPPLTDLSNLLIAEASGFLEMGKGENEWRIAVIIAHAACDIQTERTLDDLVTFKGFGDLRKSLLKPWRPQLSLHRKGVRALYASLSGRSPWSKAGAVKKAKWWDDWRTSVKRRDKVAHEGKLVTFEEASETCEACRQLVGHLQQVGTEAQRNASTQAGKDQ